MFRNRRPEGSLTITRTALKLECISGEPTCIELKAYKSRKTNEIWLLGEVKESGTLNSVEVLARYHGSAACQVYDRSRFPSKMRLRCRIFDLRVCKSKS